MITKIDFEEPHQLVIFTKKGPIHRPQIYVMAKECGWQWQHLHKAETGHWWCTIGRIVFTTM